VRPTLRRVPAEKSTAPPAAAPTARAIPLPAEQPGPVGSPWRRAFWPVAVGATVFWASGQAPPPLPGPELHHDKVAHFFVFGLFATLLLRLPWIWRRRGARAWLAIGLTSLFGAADEVRQGLNPGRVMDLADWIADTLGAAVAVVVYLRWQAYRRWLETPLWPRGRNLGSAD
jgi:VanZ family protein